MAKTDKLSIYLSFLLRHKPEDAGLPMDKHGWVSVEELIDGINRTGKYKIDGQLLCEIVKEDKKGRYRYNEDGTRIKACQGHSIPWVEPELTMMEPPEYVYHGTTTEAWEKIMASGAVNKMSRHAVHTQADVEKAWQSAFRWKKKPVVLKIAAGRMHQDGYLFGVSDNQVWCTEMVPVSYIEDVLIVRE
ncbi:MAG: RNA 2'-phosphotransferase [Lachnospiraceae bacterium]|nr:RNA 2'-phosphotransferase [Lachnospiraceae bacterium]